MKKNTTRLLVLALLTVVLCALAAAGLAAKSHTHEWKLLRTIEKPTCTKAGRGSYRCNCGDIKQDTIPALGHNWNRWTEKKAATCGEDGERTRRCARCGYTLKEKIKATGEHTYKWKTVKKATCGKAGSKQEVCTVCGHKGRTKKIPATGKHKYGDWILTKAATCTETGEETRTCTACGHRETREVKATGHRWDDGAVTKPAGFLEDGEILYTCLNDPAHTKTEAIPAEKPLKGSIMDQFRNGPVDGDPADGLSLTEETELHIVWQPGNDNLYEKEHAGLHCRAAGGVPYDDGSYLYAWYDAGGKQMDLNNIGDFVVSLEGEYYCIVEDASGAQLTSETATVYYAEPLHVVARTEDQPLKDGETVDLFAQVGGGVPPYKAVWQSYYGDDLETQQTADDTWTTAVKAEGQEWQEESRLLVYCEMTDKMGNYTFAAVLLSQYREPLTIVRTDSDPEVTNEKKASLTVEIAGGAGPYTYRLFRSGTPGIRKITYKTSTTFNVDEPGWYAIHIEDDEGRTADTEYMEVGDSRLRIIEQPQSVKIPYDPDALPSFTMTCRAEGNPEHLLMYQWQGKGADGWDDFPESPKNTLSRQEVKTDSHYYLLRSAYRCIVRDTVTGETVTSNEATVSMPMKVNAYPTDNGKSITVEVTGGFAPYSISCTRTRTDYRTFGLSFYNEKIPYEFPGGISCALYPHSATYTISGIRVKDRHFTEKDFGREVYWYYVITVTDSHGDKASDDIHYATD